MDIYKQFEGEDVSIHFVFIFVQAAAAAAANNKSSSSSVFLISIGFSMDG
jgi:hypothetical protein